MRIPQTLTETTGPSDWAALMGPAMADLTTQHKAPPQGQRIIVAGRVLDEARRPVANTVVEIWQANAAGRYIHAKDQWDAPIDPNFTGMGRVITDAGYGDAILHRTGHSLGEDVHGNGAHLDDYETHDERRLMPGSIFTIEPGVYFADSGVRTEINVVWGPDGPEVTGPRQPGIIPLV